MLLEVSLCALENTNPKCIIPLLCMFILFHVSPPWHGKTKSVTMRTELQWNMDLTPGKYLPLAKANKTKVQQASKPACMSLCLEKRSSEDIHEITVLLGWWEKVSVTQSKGARGECPRKTVGTGQDPGKPPQLPVLV